MINRYKDFLTENYEESWEEEDEIDDPEIHVGDRVIVNYSGYNIRFIDDVGEVIRIFDRNSDIPQGYFHFVVKFDNRKDLLSSKLSQYKDCYSFLAKYKKHKEIYTDYAGNEIIKKIN